MGYAQPDQTDRELMALALGQARASLEGGGVPVGGPVHIGAPDGHGAHGDVLPVGHG